MHRRDGKLIVSATDLVGFLECGHLSALDLAVADKKLAKPFWKDATLDLIRDRGGRHEGRYIEQLETEDRRITRLDGDRKRPYEERAAETIDAMRQGVDVIYQATVFDGRWVGHPDFLLRKPSLAESGADGRLGVDFHYEVADTKLAHSAKASALIQICSYVDQIERIQEVTPEHVYVVTGGAQIETLPFRTPEMMSYYRHAKTRFEEALATGLDYERSYPEPVEHCGVCRWKTACDLSWHNDDRLPIVAGITRSQRESLTQLGIRTRGALATATLEPKYERVREQARIQVESDGRKPPKHELLNLERDANDQLVADRGLSALPESNEGDLFFDIEGDPFAFWEGLEYLFGIWDGGDYTPFWAKTRVEEKAQFENVIDLFTRRLDSYPDMHVYHFGSYEPSHLKRLAGRHATREEQLDRLLRARVFVDLHRVVRQGLRAGVESYSIKRLEDLYGFARTIDLREAGDSIVEFELWLDGWLEDGQSDENILRDIELYNRDDCVSTQKLRDWLESLRGQVELRPTEALPRPSKEIQPGSDELTARQAAVRDLEQRLTASITKVEADQTEVDKATWLVRHLIDWHRRENKASWWRFYDLMSQADMDLIGEAEPIGGLEFVERIVRTGKRITTDDFRYRFPTQEHKVDVGNDVHDPQITEGETKTGTVAAIEEGADWSTIDIRRSKDWDGRHPESIVPQNIYRAPAQQDALMRFGEWVVANGIDTESAESRAARDLLLRKPPRIVGGDGGSLIRQEESGSDAARRLAPLLDGTTLAIQGPPGSGKTYTGARMILDLVKAGSRVGIAANSHKVITNLLNAVGEAADEARRHGTPVIVRGMQKVEGEDSCQLEYVKCVDSNGAVASALSNREVDVVGGTAWLWSRDEMTGLIDTLFVDEAGQMSLANVVAMSGCARNVVLLGDPQQLDQPLQGAHPPGAERSALAHLLGSAETVPPDRGLFLERTWRMHPLITEYTSRLFYEGKLDPVPGLERQEVVGDRPADGFDWLARSGLRWVPAGHDGNTNESAEEAERVVTIVRALVQREWINGDGERCPIMPSDIRIVSPFNAHRLLIDRLLKDAGLAGVPVGTVDKFQGQEAAVSIYTMATSRPEDAPRGMQFLYSLHRLNVATSRARALAIVVASPRLLKVVPRTPEQLRMANGLCAFVEVAQVAGPGMGRD